jgi:UDP-N-acetylglucosamine--N-acetylmuramyl-(pentapeptide) pyrophosphoryl-undecaprenol N-acetylglucosamine transferase
MSSPTPERLVIACGGTGGHLFPGIAVARAAKARGWETLLLISEKQIDALATQGQEDLRFEKVPAIAMPRPLSLAMLKFLWRFWKTRRHCLKLLRDFRATAVLGMGGFTSLAPAMAGKKLKLKTFVHESNAVPGKANRMTAKFCRLALLGLEECAQHFPAGRTKVTGTPLRPSLLPPGPAEHQDLIAEARRFFDLPDNKPVILIMGGSQGARGVNNAVIAALPALAAAADRVQLLHITGALDFETVRAACAAVPALTSRVVPFCQRMELAYALAAVAVCRSGASSLTELSAWGLPSVLVPYPIAADDHQRRNAAIFTRAGAALTVEEKDIAAGQLGPLLLDLIADPEKRRALSEAMRRLAPTRAAEQICDTITGE